MHPKRVEGDLLDQPVEVIVNAWNQNFIPWWLLLPQGLSGAIKRRGGTAPFREIGRTGFMPLGSARLTGAGKLPFRGIIHVAGINVFWRATRRSIRDSVNNAMRIVADKGFESIAFPLIGSGSWGMTVEKSLAIMMEAFGELSASATVIVVRFKICGGDVPPCDRNTGVGN